MSSDIKKVVGQLFIVGFNGYSISPDFKKFIQDYHLGGVIYFKRNVSSPAQLAELSNDIQFSCRNSADPFLLISIDHEGGKVNRLVKPFTKFPGNDYLGELGSPKVGFNFGVVIAKELKAVGINVNFAPVIDVNTNPNNPVIKNRSFSSDPEVCAKLGSAVSRGIQKMGVMAVAKHFPGHGDTKEDSHFSLPKYQRELSDLEKVELIPFRRLIRSKVEGIMTGHLWNTLLDPDFPCTLSHKTITGLLRVELRYQRLIISDDMEMKAIKDNFKGETAAHLAFLAGVDLLIYKGDEGPPINAIESVIKAVQDKKIPFDLLEQAYSRLMVAKKTYCELKTPVDVTQVGNSIGLPEHFKLADIITKKELPEGELEEFSSMS